jgi:serine/threonine-protein kinase
MGRLWVGLAYAALAAAVAGIGAYLAVSMVVERAPEVVVPEVEGLGLSDALDELNALGLDLEVRAFVYSDEVEENRIVRQQPAAGKVVKGGRGIGLVLSRGSERHPVPDLRGLSLEDARILLEEARLKAEVTIRIPRGPEGQVVAQGVAPGHRLAADAAVPLVLSSGPKPVFLRMPRLEGLALEQSLAELDALGLQAARVEEVSLEDPSRQGRVVSHDPLPGFPVARGEGVIVSVAISSRPWAAWRSAWISRTLPVGFGRHRVEVVVDRGGRSWPLVDVDMDGGETFRLWVHLRPGEEIRVRVDGEASWGAIGPWDAEMLRE